MASLSDYKNLVEIGHGGMATVYRATAPNGNLVAVKVLAYHLAADATALRRFQTESNLGLVHPNIVKILDTGVEQGTPFIVMEYVAGQSLDRVLAKKIRLTPKELAPILRDTARALDYAHGKKVVHRDVKPSNIHIRSNGMALLGDFGVAKLHENTNYTGTTSRVGSAYYMSPEQARGDAEITKASDIYSLGVTAYYALTGRLPFEGDNEIAVARMHIDTKPTHVSDANPYVPRHVGAVIMQALEKQPERRPKSAGQFSRAFNQAIGSKAPVKVPRAIMVAPVVALLIGILAFAGIMTVTGTFSRLMAQYSATAIPTRPASGIADAGALSPAARTATATPTNSQKGGTVVLASKILTPTAAPTFTPPPPTRTPAPRTPTPAPTRTPHPTMRSYMPPPPIYGPIVTVPPNRPGPRHGGPPPQPQPQPLPSTSPAPARTRRPRPWPGPGPGRATVTPQPLQHTLLPTDTLPLMDAIPTAEASPTIEATSAAPSITQNKNQGPQERSAPARTHIQLPTELPVMSRGLSSTR